MKQVFGTWLEVFNHGILRGLSQKHLMDGMVMISLYIFKGYLKESEILIMREVLVW